VATLTKTVPKSRCNPVIVKLSNVTSKCSTTSAYYMERSTTGHVASLSFVVKISSVTGILHFVYRLWMVWGDLKLSTLVTLTYSQSDRMKTLHWSGCCTPFHAILIHGWVH